MKSFELGFAIERVLRQHIRGAWRGFLALTLCSLGVFAAHASDQKLVLTDGSDQIVRSYEIIGNRVRYFSAERMDWEEIPKDLVDWEATEAVKRAAEQALEAERAKAAEVKPRVLVEAAGNSSRLLMPDQEGIYVLSTPTAGEARRAGLTKLAQAQAVVENNKKRSLLTLITPVPIVKGKATILLPGKNSRAQIQPSAMAIYIMLTPPEPASKDFAAEGKPGSTEAEAMPAEKGGKPSAKNEQAASMNLKQTPNAASAFSLVRVKSKGNERVVGEITFSPIGGSMSESREIVPATFEMAFPAQIDADGDSLPVVWKLQPTAPLTAGEYAVIEFVDHERQNLFVWDFGVGGTAPASPAKK